MIVGAVVFLGMVFIPNSVLLLCGGGHVLDFWFPPINYLNAGVQQFEFAFEQIVGRVC